MSSAANISIGRKPNALLSYARDGKVYSAHLRCSKLSYGYSINSEESHARRARAFYPHRVNQGSFALTFDLIHWEEYSRAMDWFHGYASSVLNNNNPSVMRVRLPSRNFARHGVPTDGITYGDHIGSMLFQPTITFVSTNNVLDPKAGNGNGRPSFTEERQGQLSTQWFYPDSEMSRPGALQRYLYDKRKEAQEGHNATISQVIHNTTSGGTAYF